MKKHLFTMVFAICLLVLTSFSAFAANDIVWDFDDNTVQNLSISNVASHSVQNGVLKLDLSETTGDVMITAGLNVSASNYRYVMIDMKHNIPDGSMGTHPLEVFFKLSGYSWSQSRSVGASLVSASDTFNTYIVDLGSNSNYSGIVEAIRIDPVDTMSQAGTVYTVEIDKITFVAEDKIGLIEWNFDDNTSQGWSVKNGVDKGVSNGVYKVALSSSNPDTWIQHYELNFEAADYKYLVVDMRHNIPDAECGNDAFLGLFTRTTDNPWQAHLLASTNTRYSASSEFKSYIVDMSKCSYWNSTIDALRIDPFQAVSGAEEYYFEIDRIYMSYDVKLTLEDTEYTVPAGVKINLSDYNEPVKPGFIFAGWKKAGTTEIITTIELTEDTSLEAVWMDKMPEWTFDTDTTEGWQSNASGTLSAENGALKILLHNTNNDVYIYTSNQDIDTSVYKYAVVYMKHNVPESAWDSTPFQFLFYNTNSSWWSEMLVNTDRKPASDTYEKYVFNMGANRYWTGIIPRLRFDPFQITAPTLGDYVVWVDKIVMCPEIKLTFDFGFADMANITYALPGGVDTLLSEFAEPECDGYKFLGWTDADGKAVTSVNTFSNVTLYASWKATSPSITLTESYVSVANLEEDAVLVLSGYDMYGRLKDTVTKPVSGDYTVKLGNSGLEINGVKTVKAFLFDGLDTLSPLCKEKSVLLYMFDYQELEGEEYGLMGRWFDFEHDNGNTYKASFTPGSEIYFKVSGTTSVKMKLNNEYLWWNPYIAVSVDGGAPERMQISKLNEKQIVSGLDADKEHFIRVTVDSFAYHQSNKWINGNGLVLEYIKVDNGGTMTGIMPKNPVIAFYGDSITEGLGCLYASEGVPEDSSHINSYSFNTAQLLGMTAHMSGYGATGISVAGCGGVPKCIDVIDEVKEGTPLVMPELTAIVVNHGHNDLNMSVSDADFAKGYKEVLVRLREKHPDATIFAVVPYAQRYVDTIKNVVEEMDDDNIYYISTAGWEYTTTDGVHPDVVGARKLSARLAEEIGKVLGLGGF